MREPPTSVSTCRNIKLTYFTHFSKLSPQTGFTCCCLPLHTALNSEQKAVGAVKHTSARKRCSALPEAKLGKLGLPGPSPPAEVRSCVFLKIFWDLATLPRAQPPPQQRLAMTLQLTPHQLACVWTVSVLKLPSVMNSLTMPQRECQALLTPHDRHPETQSQGWRDGSVV